MSLDFCLPDLIAEGRITPEDGVAIERLFGDIRTQYRKTMGDAAADAAASQAALEQLEKAALHKKKNALLQVQAQRQAMLDALQYGTGAGGFRALDPEKPGHLGEAFKALYVRSEYAPYMNVEYQLQAIRGEAHATLSKILSRHGRDVLGRVREPAELDDLVRELFTPGSTGKASAREMAEAWSEAAEMLRRRFNAAGGDIARLEGWALPQSHDGEAIMEAGFRAWRDAIEPRLDREKMIDRATGQAFTDEAFGAVLQDAYDTITTRGWMTREPSGAAIGKSLANRRTDHRFFQFKSADDWIAYQQRFGGKATPFDAMMAHVEGMARDIAMMERLGPNPATTLRWMQQAIEKDGMLRGGDHAKKVAGGVNRMQRIHDEVSGANSAPENVSFAHIGSAIRSYQVATKLGSAVLSTTSDQATQILARKMNGLPVSKMVASQLKLLNPRNVADRELAMRMGLTAQGASNMAAATSRMTGEELTGDVSRRLAEGVLRVSGLNAVTEAGRWSFGMDFLSHIALERGKGFASLDPSFRSAFQRYGLGEADWDVIRAVDLIDEHGARWLLPENVPSAQRQRMMRMILSEMDMAVPMPGLEIQAAMNSSLRRGTLPGELGRSLFQFKSFPITIMLQQYRRTMAQQGWNRAAYAAEMVVLTTLAGATALQLKEIAKGRDFRPLYVEDDPGATAAFWGAAFAQGGGGGIYGDFLKSSTSRFGGGFADTLMGPAFQTGDQLIAKPIGMVAAALQGEDPNVGGWFTKAIKSEVPGMSLWYGRLAFERLMLDGMQRQIDPNYRESWRRLERYAEEQGQDYYWAPGAGVNEARAPDVSNLIQEE